MRRIIILVIGLSLIFIPGLLSITFLIGVFCPKIRVIMLKAVGECREDLKHLCVKLINNKTTMSLIVISAVLTLM
jgi:hypothetical protein